MLRLAYKSSDFNSDLYENDDFNSGARTDETTTKASTPTEERLINDRLASKLSLYDDDDDVALILNVAF